MSTNVSHLGVRKGCKLPEVLDDSMPQIGLLLGSGRKTLEIDCSRARFVSVDGMEWLEELLLRAGSIGCKISFVRVPPELYKAFKVSHNREILAACGGVAASANPAC